MAKKQIDITYSKDFFSRVITAYNFSYTFRNMPYLVADKFGNFFVLPNCKHNRTTEFKQLNSDNGYIYYQRNKVRLSTLRKRVVYITSQHTI